MHCSDDAWISFYYSLSLYAYATLTSTLISSGAIIWNKQNHFSVKHDGATGSGTHPARSYNLVSTCPPVQQQGRFLSLNQPFAVPKMQRGKEGVHGLHIQASGNMDFFMEHPKRKQSCSEPVQRASVSPYISFNSYWPACMIGAVKCILVALLIYPHNGWIACFYELSWPIMRRMSVFSSYCRLLRSRYAKFNRMKYTVKASVVCIATTSLTTCPRII